MLRGGQDLLSYQSPHGRFAHFEDGCRFLESDLTSLGALTFTIWAVCYGGSAASTHANSHCRARSPCLRG